MAFFDKLNQVAKNIGDKTSDAIETTRLNSKIAAEKLAANEELLKIGQHYYDLYLTGQADEAILEYCQAAKSHLDTADQLQAEIERIKSDSTAPTAPVGGTICPGCGTSLPAGTKFCANCGSKVETAPVVQPQNVFCPGCGTQLPPGTKFCNSCGRQLNG